MPNTIVIGMQWGDEGKGKIVDLICPAFDVVVRYQGGHNAGHTVKFGEQHFTFHLVPSGIVRRGVKCVLGNGMVISPEAFFEELEELEALGAHTKDDLYLSNRAHLLLPAYAALDEAREKARGANAIGTTARGIGPAYECKASRYGLRLCDLSAGDLDQRLRSLLLHLEHEAVALSDEPIGHPSRLGDYCREWRERLEPYLHDTDALLHRWIDEGKSLLFEGAQGTLLDIDHGTYPYVTSSNSTAGGACTGSGVPPTRIDGVIGVLKAYTTRVGGGPFLTELDDHVGEYLRLRGHEFGTTTGRPRRCGWLDLAAARYARAINGVDTIALTKLDILDELKEIQVCVGYKVDGETLDRPPASLDRLARAEPIYRTVPGWQTPTKGALDYSYLPQAARDYVSLIEDEVGAPVSLVSSGPRREETVVRNETRLVELTDGRLDRV